jgi:transcriptional regulator with XRE-family HTH domain
MNTLVYKNIKIIREMRNLTRDYVAAELDMTASGYGKIERGEIDITISKIYRLAAIFEITVSDLLFFNVSSVFNNSKKYKLESKLSDLENPDAKVMTMHRNTFDSGSDLQKQNAEIYNN